MKSYNELQAKIAENDAVIAELKAEIVRIQNANQRDRGMYDATIGVPANSDNEHYLDGFCFAYTRQEKVTGMMLEDCF